MTRVRRILATLLIACPFVASPPEADASGGRTTSGVRRILPRVGCSVVAFPDRGAPVSAGQTVKIPGKTAKLWMKVILENQGLTPQTVNLQMLFRDGTRDAINKVTPNVQVTPDRPVESGVWSADLGEGTHKVRAAGVILGLKDNAESNECVVDFTVEVGASSTVRERHLISPALAAPDLTCGLRMEWVRPSGDVLSVNTGQNLQIPEQNPNLRAYVNVVNGRSLPYGRAVKVHLKWYTSQGVMLVNRELTIQGPIGPGDNAVSQLVGVPVPGGRTTIHGEAEIVGVPNNRTVGFGGNTSCAALIGITATVGPSPPPASSVFTDRVYPILTVSACLTCHMPTGTAGRARALLAFSSDGITPRSAAVLCNQVRGQISPNTDTHPEGPLPQSYMDAVSLWRDTLPPPTYKCP